MQTLLDYAALFDASPYPNLLLDKQMVVIGANHAYLHAISRSNDIVGRHICTVFSATPGEPHSATLAQLITSVERVIATRQQHKVPFIKIVVQRMTPQGIEFEERYWSAVFVPVMGADNELAYISQHAIDVTDIYIAQQAKREADERLREGMNVARMVTWDMDLRTGSMQFSENATAILGAKWTSREAVWRWLHPEDAQRLHAAREGAIEQRSNYNECVRFIRPDTGSVMWLQVMANVCCDRLQVPSTMRGVSLDVTERMRAEANLRDADLRKDEFLAMLAHELRNPLAPISAAAQILKMRVLKPELIRKTGEVIARQVNHMTSLVDDLLDVSRVTRGLISIDRKPLNIAEIVNDAVEQVRPLITARCHELAINLPENYVKLLGDQKRLVQVLTNLLNNAAKYTPEGGNLKINVTTTEAQVVVCVQDDGIGIVPELLPHIFDLFTQAERTPDRSQGGLGLGLALVRSLISLHGGSVTATSEGRKGGSTFCVKLPRVVERLELAGNAPLPTASSEDQKGLRLLVVDDNTDAAEMLGAFMESAGHHVTIEYEPYQAIERARTETLDVCLLDIGLPGMDGNQLARCLRRMPQMSQTTLIAVTGYGKDFDRDASIAAGFDYYFVKPADPTALVALLEKIQVH